MFVEASLHGIRDRMLALRSLPAFAGMGDELALHVVESSRQRRFRAGEELFSETIPTHCIYFVIAGRITVTYHGAPIQVIAGSGVIGVIAALANTRLGWRAVAEHEALVLELAIDEFRALLLEDFTLLRNTVRVIAGLALRQRGNLPVKRDHVPAELGVYPERDPTLVERVVVMRNTPGPFSTANMEAIIDLARCQQPVRVEPGHVLFEAGAPALSLIQIEYGRVRCTTPTGESVEVGNGMVLGVLDAWSSQPSSYSARAETRVVGYRTYNEDALAVLEMHPAVTLRMLADLAASITRG